MLREEWITFAKNFRPRDSELLIRSYDTLMGNVYADEVPAMGPGHYGILGH